jgi:hypothetical protein
MKYQRTPPVRPSRLLIWQGGSDSREERWTERENRDLVAGGFELTDDEDDLWKKDGVWFGREAALQSASKEQHAGVRSTTPPNEKMLVQDGIPLGYVSVEQFAKTVGVTATRIVHLIKRGRVVGVELHNNRYLIPEDARILPATKEMPGPMTDYIKSWHERNKVSYLE